MSFADEKARWQGWTIDIVGTDLSRAAIERARAGIYSQFEVQRGLPVMQMIRWFEELGGGDWRIVADSCATRSASRSATSSSRRRIRAGSTSSCAATSCSISRPTCAGWPSAGSPRRSRPTAR